MSVIAPSTSKTHRLHNLRASLSAEATQNPVNLELGHRKPSQIVMIGDRSFDIEDAPAPQSPCIAVR
jgi:phosphoglycolate phosphatase-like HAD superfamily hydrolase